jgi:hypothetical protein
MEKQFKKFQQLPPVNKQNRLKDKKIDKLITKLTLIRRFKSTENVIKNEKYPHLSNKVSKIFFSFVFKGHYNFRNIEYITF